MGISGNTGIENVSVMRGDCMGISGNTGIESGSVMWGDCMGNFRKRGHRKAAA
ncbi:hypothetical protein NQ534_02750 [Marvinbryantia formatexigens DSM 14469]|nr:hypothetical protein [Marvinbryantia formatexigens]UWO25429.1 hypothetical protein NQ534_02750 [Marvinbryantia formatexigens DSM 14469]SDG74811.1 hypothetical protein SAMN05660368_03197 [Marvinbryantia formatexigens]